MKNFVVILLATCVVSAVAPAIDGSEQGRQNALQRFVESPVSTDSRIKQNDPAAIAKLIDEINAAARKNKQRMLSIIVINTDVAGSTLEEEKARYDLTLGDVYVAHALALATQKKASALFALHKAGKTWAQIAKSHNVSLKGSSELIKEMQRQ
jgi:hypothetical protein